MKPGTNIPMVELEAELASREGTSLCAQICEELGNERRVVQGRMASGLEPAKFEPARRWCAALEAAERAVRGYVDLTESIPRPLEMKQGANRWAST
jgi:hypothetical protein